MNYFRESQFFLVTTEAHATLLLNKIWNLPINITHQKIHSDQEKIDILCLRVCAYVIFLSVCDDFSMKMYYLHGYYCYIHETLLKNVSYSFNSMIYVKEKLMRVILKVSVKFRFWKWNVWIWCFTNITLVYLKTLYFWWTARELV